jgi:hypothetical protein
MFQNLISYLTYMCWNGQGTTIIEPGGGEEKKIKKSLEKYIQGISMMTNAITILKGFQGCKSSYT